MALNWWFKDSNETLTLSITTNDVPAVATALAAGIGWNLTRRRWLAAGACGVAGAAGLALWQRPRRYEFEGVVTDTDNQPLANVVVSAGNTSTRTDAAGRFRLRLPGAKPAWVRLQFSKAGYKPELRNAATGETFPVSGSTPAGGSISPLPGGQQLRGLLPARPYASDFFLILMSSRLIF
jgi:hypothetical protein